MIACLDVDYRDSQACAAGLVFSDWSSDAISAQQVALIDRVEPYVPGSFYLRELPCLLEVLRKLSSVEMVLVDGYVWLEDRRPGLGARLHGELGGQVPVIGVAKTMFNGAVGAVEVLRGQSARPLFVSAVGVSCVEAAGLVKRMHGAYRIPTLLNAVDHLARTGWSTSS